MTAASLQSRIEHYFSLGAAASDDPGAHEAFAELRDQLTAGTIRSASPDATAPHGWQIHSWIKQGILLGFRLGKLEATGGHDLSFVDKDTFPVRHLTVADGVRIVAGGSAVRIGAYVAPGVVCMPPSYVNVGAYVDTGALVDSHALVGTCAQIGKRVHLSAAAQIGGVLEPVNASPVIIEDDVLVGGNCGVYEGTLVRKRAVLAPGTILTRATPIYDLVNGTIIRSSADAPLIVPENGVVVPGSRAVNRGQAAAWNISLYTPVIVKYRDEKTDLAVALEDLLR